MDYRLTDNVFEQLATLSKLELTDMNKTYLCKDLEQLLAYVDKISELSTDDTLPLTHFPECICRLDTGSPSAITLSSQPAQLVALAPEQTDSYYVVPNTFQNHS